MSVLSETFGGAFDLSGQGPAALLSFVTLAPLCRFLLSSAVVVVRARNPLVVWWSLSWVPAVVRGRLLNCTVFVVVIFYPGTTHPEIWKFGVGDAGVNRRPVLPYRWLSP